MFIRPSEGSSDLSVSGTIFFASLARFSNSVTWDHETSSTFATLMITISKNALNATEIHTMNTSGPSVPVFIFQELFSGLIGFNRWLIVKT